MTEPVLEKCPTPECSGKVEVSAFPGPTSPERKLYSVSCSCGWRAPFSDAIVRAYSVWNAQQAEIAALRAQLADARKVKALVWTDIRNPDGGKTSFYTHAIAETPLGPITIEWKGWKDHDNPTCELPWPNGFVCGHDLEHCKELVQQEFDKLYASLSALEGV